MREYLRTLFDDNGRLKITEDNFTHFVHLMLVVMALAHLFYLAISLMGGVGAPSYYNVFSFLYFLYLASLTKHPKNISKIPFLMIAEILVFVTVYTYVIEENCWFYLVIFQLITFVYVMEYYSKMLGIKMKLPTTFYVVWICAFIALNFYISCSDNRICVPLNSQAAYYTITGFNVAIAVTMIVVYGYIFASITSTKSEHLSGKNELLVTQLVDVVARSVEAKDLYTKGHSKRVAKYSRLIARRAGWEADQVAKIYNAGFLHDVGKIRIPDEIINKPGKLTDEEYDYIKMHSNAGYHILKGIDDAPEYALAARYHHERYDGNGYPMGLAGEDIPEIARIIAVADTYDAMTSNRSYRKFLPQDEVYKEIERVSGTQLDPRFASIMLDIIKQDRFYRYHQMEDGCNTVLVVTNNDEQRNLIEEYLGEEESIDLITVTSEEEVVDILSKGKEIDVILLDSNINGISGLKVFYKLRDITDIPVILIMETKNYEAIRKLQDEGVYDYITKPIKKRNLSETVLLALREERG